MKLRSSNNLNILFFVSSCLIGMNSHTSALYKAEDKDVPIIYHSDVYSGHDRTPTESSGPSSLDNEISLTSKFFGKLQKLWDEYRPTLSFTYVRDRVQAILDKHIRAAQEFSYKELLQNAKALDATVKSLQKQLELLSTYLSDIETKIYVLTGEHFFPDITKLPAQLQYAYLETKLKVLNFQITLEAAQKSLAYTNQQISRYKDAIIKQFEQATPIRNASEAKLHYDLLSKKIKSSPEGLYDNLIRLEYVEGKLREFQGKDVQGLQELQNDLKNGGIVNHPLTNVLNHSLFEKGDPILKIPGVAGAGTTEKDKHDKNFEGIPVTPFQHYLIGQEKDQFEALQHTVKGSGGNPDPDLAKQATDAHNDALDIVLTGTPQEALAHVSTSSFLTSLLRNTVEFGKGIMRGGFSSVGLNTLTVLIPKLTPLLQVKLCTDIARGVYFGARCILKDAEALEVLKSTLELIKQQPFDQQIGYFGELVGAYLTKDTHLAKGNFEIIKDRVQKTLKVSSVPEKVEQKKPSIAPVKIDQLKPKIKNVPQPKLKVEGVVPNPHTFLDEAIAKGIELTLRDINKFKHVFDEPMHKLNQLVQKYGSQEKVIEAVYRACKDKLPKEGEFKDVPISLDGTIVYIRGNIVNNIPRIGTFFIK